MRNFEDESVVLWTKEVNEYNKIVYLLTRDHGKLKAIAYGARKLKNRFGSALEPFSYGRAMFTERKSQSGLSSLDSFEIITSAFVLFSDYVAAAHLYYYAELLHSVLPDEQPEEHLFRLTLEMLRGFRKGLAADRIAAYFEIWLLKLLGSLPDYRVCHHCKKPLAGTKRIFIAPEGYLFCDDCNVKGLDRGDKIEGSLNQFITNILKCKIDNDSLNLKSYNNVQVTDWTHRLLNNLLGKELKSYQNLKEIRNY